MITIKILDLLLCKIGMLFVKLGFGKKGMEARLAMNKQGKGWAYLWGILIYIWVPSMLLYLAIGDGSVAALIGIMFIFPIPYLLFVLLARLSVPRLVEEAQEYPEKIRREREERRALEEKRLMASVRKQAEQEGRADAPMDLAKALGKCRKVADIQTVWNACSKEGIDQQTQNEIQRRLNSKATQERVYGVSAERTNELVKEIKGLAGL